jgi:hypothetical protein
VYVVKDVVGITLHAYVPICDNKYHVFPCKNVSNATIVILNTIRCVDFLVKSVSQSVCLLYARLDSFLQV